MKDNLNIKVDGRGKDRIEIIETLLDSRNVDEFELLNPSDDDLVPYDNMLNLAIYYLFICLFVNKCFIKRVISILLIIFSIINIFLTFNTHR